jgi:hypothetical protein
MLSPGKRRCRGSTTVSTTAATTKPASPSAVASERWRFTPIAGAHNRVEAVRIAEEEEWL